MKKTLMIAGIVVLLVLAISWLTYIYSYPTEIEKNITPISNNIKESGNKDFSGTDKGTDNTPVKLLPASSTVLQEKIQTVTGQTSASKLQPVMTGDTIVGAATNTAAVKASSKTKTIEISPSSLDLQAEINQVRDINK